MFNVFCTVYLTFCKRCEMGYWFNTKLYLADFAVLFWSSLVPQCTGQLVNADAWCKKNTYIYFFKIHNQDADGIQ